jgi:hypothetical protein
MFGAPFCLQSIPTDNLDGVLICVRLDSMSMYSLMGNVNRFFGKHSYCPRRLFDK